MPLHYKKVLLLLGCLLVFNLSVFSETLVLVYKAARRTPNSILLVFEANGKQYLFDAAKSNVNPYVLYSTGNDGTIKVNEKLRNHLFRLSFGFWPTDRSILFIISLQEIGGSARVQ